VDDPSQGERIKPVALQLDLPGPTPVVAELEPATRPSLVVRRRSVLRLLVAGALIAAACAVAVVFVLPGYVRRACVEQAAAHGIALAIDGVRISGTGFALSGVKATASDFPGASVEAPEVDVETLDLRPEKLTASGMTVVLDGRWNAISAAFASWRASDRGGQGGAWAPASLVVDGSRVVWRGPIGDNARVEASGVHLDVTWRDREPTLHATSSNVIVAVPGGSLGPWRFDLDRDPSASRARVALDPGVPDACTVLVVGNDQTINSVDVAVPRSPVARLGIAPALLGLHGDIQLAAALHYAPFGPQANANARTKGGLYGISLPGIPRPIDVSWDASASADRDAATAASRRATAIDIKDARIAVGPLVGAAHGTLKIFDDGFHADIAWHAGPVPCSAFDAPLDPAQPFDIAYQLRKLAENTGLARIRGNVSANASITFDSRDLGSTVVSFVPTATCDVALGP
jgi:hypothetical protein